MKALLVALSLNVSSCGMSHESLIPDISTSHRTAELEQKYNLYLELLKDHQDPETGWYEPKDCDALLFNGLLHFAGASGIQLDLAKEENGRWHRTPDQGCYAEGRSGSTISRDMLAGLMFGADLESRREMYEFGISRNWKMGDGPADRVFYTPPFINTLAISIGKGKVMEELWVDPIKGHQRHVVGLNALYRSMTSRTGIKESTKVMKTLKHHDPDNLLFFYFLARQGLAPMHQVVDALLDNHQWFPPDRLPTTDDRCSRWIWERPENRDPVCPDKVFKTHSGGDFLFIAGLVLGQSVR